jgi:hypothetical protein
MVSANARIVDESGRFIYEGRFDEDNFEGAYRELTSRYCAGEGAAVAEGIALGADLLIGANRGEFDRVFGELTAPEMRVINRSSGVFPDRTAAQLIASIEELNAMVEAVRMWNSVECWMSPRCVVARHERQAVGHDGERYEWARIFVFEAVDGRCTGLAEFDLNDELAAFAYAEERMRRHESR